MFGEVVAGTLTIKGLLKKACMRDLGLYDTVSITREVGFAYMDEECSSGERNMWCLAIEQRDDDLDSDCETLCSETSLEYPGNLRGLLLLPVVEDVSAYSWPNCYRRVGMFKGGESYGSEHWFDDCLPQTVVVI